MPERLLQPNDGRQWGVGVHSVSAGHAWGQHKRQHERFFVRAVRRGLVPAALWRGISGRVHPVLSRDLWRNGWSLYVHALCGQLLQPHDRRTNSLGLYSVRGGHGA
jgi:hypothetical protein